MGSQEMDIRKRTFAKSKMKSPFDTLSSMKRRKIRAISTPSGKSVISAPTSLKKFTTGIETLKDEETIGKSKEFSKSKSSTGGPISAAIELLRGMVRSKTSLKSNRSEPRRSQSKKESVETPAKVVTIRDKPKPKKPKAKKVPKFRKADFINKMKETENLLLEYEKTRRNMEIDRKKMYRSWDMVADKIVMEKKSQSCLKKKMEALKLEDRHGLWEVSRRDKVNFASNYHSQLVKLRATYINAMSGAVTDIGKRNYEYQKNIFDYNVCKHKLHQGMADYYFDSWKQKSEEHSKFIQQFMPALKNKSHQLNKRLDQQVNEKTLKLTCNYNPVPIERLGRVEDIFGINFRMIETLLETNSTTADAIYKLIKKSTDALTKGHRLESHMKKERDKVAERYKTLKDRLIYLHERCTELKRIVVASASISSMSKKCYKRQKRKMDEQSDALVDSYTLNAAYDDLKQTCKTKREDVVNDFVRAKRDFFRRAVCALEGRCEASLVLQELINLVKQEWKLDIDPYFLPTRIKRRQELKFPQEGYTIYFGEFTKQILERTSNMSKTTVDLFQAALIYYQKNLVKSGMDSSSLDFLVNVRKFFNELSVVAKKQQSVMQTIKEDTMREKKYS